MLWNSCGLDTLVLLPPNSPVSESLHRDRAVRTGAFSHVLPFHTSNAFRLFKHISIRTIQWIMTLVVFNVAQNHLFCQRLLWLLLVTQDMGASQSSVCQVFINISFLLCKVDHIICFLGCKFLFVRLRQRRQGLWQGLVLVSVQAWLPPWTLSRCTILYL